jgi:hypothetical protein
MLLLSADTMTRHIETVVSRRGHIIVRKQFENVRHGRRHMVSPFSEGEVSTIPVRLTSPATRALRRIVHGHASDGERVPMFSCFRLELRSPDFVEIADRSASNSDHPDSYSHRNLLYLWVVYRKWGWVAI